MNHYVYIITNLMNGKKYIGKRSCRCKIEDDKYMGSGKLLHRAFKKYGMENFEKKILMVCDTEEEAFSEEEKAIQLVRAWKNPMYYNMIGGGRGTGSGESHRMSLKVVCLNTDEIFNTIEEAKCKYRIVGNSISDVCLGKRISSGKHPITGEPLIWMFANDYQKLSKKEISYKVDIALNLTGRGRFRKVVCLNTREVFSSISDASRKYHMKTASGINSCVVNRVKSSGTHPITKEKLVWRYLEDYEKMTESDVKSVVQNAQIKKEDIICVNTGEIFESIGDACKKYNTFAQGVLFTCRGLRNSAGKHPITGEKLKWMYLEDYNKLHKSTINHTINVLDKKKSNIRRRIICLNTNEIFSSLCDAGKRYNLNTGNIASVCKGIQKTSGTHPITGEKLRWMYLEDYLKTNKNQMEFVTNDFNGIDIKNVHPRAKKVICLNTNKVFDTAKESGEYYKLSTCSGIIQCCKGKRKSSGRLNGEKLRWMYLEDYENKYGKIDKDVI